MVSSLFRWRRPEDDVVVEIELYQNPNAAYTPGSEISGRVVLRSPTPVLVERLNLNFFGHCKTHFTRTQSTGTGGNRRNTTIHYRDDANLFHYGTDLAQHATVQDQPAAWDFRFTFPQSTQNARNDYVNQMANNQIWTDLPHPIPPSFNNVKGSGEAEVSYGLDAFVYFPNNDTPTVKGAVLNFSPFSRLESLPFIEIKKSHHYASRALIGQEPSFMESIADKLSKHTPNMDFTMKASINAQMIVSITPFPIFVTLQIDKLSGEDIKVPNIKLRIKRIKLYPFTMLRAVRESAFGDYRFNKEEMETWEEESILLNAIPESATVEPKHVSDSSASKKGLSFPFTFEARIPSEACPNFRTFNITHTHTLQLTLEATILGKTFELSDEPAVILLSPFSDRMPAQAFGLAHTRSPAPAPAPDEALPQYTPVASTAESSTTLRESKS